MSSKVAIPLYISTSDPWGFQFLHILVSTCYCLSYHSHLSRCEVVSQCGFDLHFQKLVRLTLHVRLLQRNVCENLLCVFLGLLVFLSLSVLYVFQLQTLYQTCDSQLFSLSLWFLLLPFLNVRVPLLFPVLCSFLLYTMNRLCPIRIFRMHLHAPSLLGLHLPPTLHLTHLSHHRAASWAPCVILQVPTPSLLYMEVYMYQYQSPLTRLLKIRNFKFWCSQMYQYFLS